MTKYLAQSAAGAVALLVIQMAAGIAFGPGPVPSPPHTLPWVFASDVIVSATITWLARRSAWRGARLALALGAVAWIPAQASSLLEAYVFNVVPQPGEILRLLTQSFIVTVLFILVVVGLTGGWRRKTVRTAQAHWSALEWSGRLALCAAAYLALYFTAGTIIFPYVRWFYDQRSIPSTFVVVALQLLVRGPIFALTGALVARMIAGSRRQHALAVAGIMSLLAGVAPLIIPNPYFPDQVRWVHFAEVVSSNCIAGLIIGWIMSPRGGEAAPSAVRSAA